MNSITYISRNVKNRFSFKENGDINQIESKNEERALRRDGQLKQ